MKLLQDIPELDLLAQALEFNGPGVHVQARAEVYSAKAVAQERQLFRRIDAAVQADIELSSSTSPPDGPKSAPYDSAFGPLGQRSSRKTFGLLIATLNLAYPDHDFGSLKPDEFVREPSAAAVLASLSSALSHLRASSTATPGFNLGSGQSSVFRSFAAYPASPPKVSVALPVSQTLSGSSYGSEDAFSSTPIANAALHPFFRQVLDPIIDLNECEVFSFSPEAEDDPHADDDESSVGDFEVDELDGFLDDDASMRADSDSEDDIESSLWRLDGLSYASTPRRRPISRVSSAAPSPFSVPPKRSLSMLSINDDAPRRAPSGGLLWSSNYFFFHRSSKRILFLTLWARTRGGLAAFAPTQQPTSIASIAMPRKSSTSTEVFARPAPPLRSKLGSKQPTPEPLKASTSVNVIPMPSPPVVGPVRKRPRL